MNVLHIIKIGGAVINNPSLLNRCLDDISTLAAPMILVHGGGRHVDQWLHKIGHDIQMNEGRRITDDITLELAVMTYAGWTNKLIVSGLQCRGMLCLGLSGADLNSIQSTKRVHPAIDFGWVGDVTHVNNLAFETLLEKGISPVCCAITHDESGQLLNTNADTIASSIASALAGQYEVNLWYAFEKKGVLLNIDDENSIVPLINASLYDQMIKEGKIHAGMKPKLDNCFAALSQGVHNIHIISVEEIGQIPNAGGTKISLK